MAKRSTAGVEGRPSASTTPLHLEEPVSSLHPRVDEDALLAYGDGVPLTVFQAELRATKNRITRLLGLKRVRELTEDDARAVFLRDVTHLDDEAKEALLQVRASLELLLHAAPGLEFERVLSEILDAQRQRKNDLLAEFGEAGIPRREPPESAEDRDAFFDAIRRFKVFGRMQRMFSRREDRVVDEEETYVELPPTAEAQAALWDDGFVIDPTYMSEELMLDYGIEQGDSDLVKLQKKAARIPALKERLATARPIETHVGSRTRVAVLDDGVMLVTRNFPDTGGQDGRELIAYMSRNAYRVQRERTHLVEGTREEAERFEGIGIQARRLHAEYPRWKSYTREEQDELNTRLLTLLETMRQMLGNPLRPMLQRVQEIYGTVLRLLRNPGAIMATVRKAPEILGEIAEGCRIQASTVRAEQDTLTDEIHRARMLRTDGLAESERILAAPDGQERSAAAIQGSLESILDVTGRYGSVLQPFASMQATVRTVAAAARDAAKEQPDGWREAFAQHARALSTLFRAQGLVEEIDQVEQLLSPPRQPLEARPNRRSFTPLEAPGVLASALERIDAIVERGRGWEPGMQAEETFRILENIATAARLEKDPCVAVKELRASLKRFDALERSDRIADEVCATLGVERPPVPGRAAKR